ncbi:hypothetical protein NEDG_01513 [Nematocida displodere]|uniref:Uncharacterized protein n=1 Tax=Nematocida displodere TaxID=1805483 RepID=A0A177EE25_9MICR|nr:hypothetical protein NEDG_01513 [Nematocida displodere]
MNKDREDDTHTELEVRLGRLSSLMNLFREKLDSLEKTTKSLEDRVSAYATELANAHKETTTRPI